MKKVLIALIVVVLGVLGYVLVSKDVVTAPEQANRIVSNYGFSFTLPSGWQTVEGYSASMSLIEDDKFLSVFESGDMIGWTEEDLSRFQSTIDNWTYEDSKFFVFSDSETFDYLNRDFGYVGSLWSREIEVRVKEGINVIDMEVIDGIPDLNISESDRLNQYFVDIEGVDALVTVGNYFEGSIDLVFVSLPLQMEYDTMKNDAKWIRFNSFVSANDEESVNKVIDFIGSLNITSQ